MSSDSNLVACPYNPKHIIRQTRMAYHLIKCRENHPGVNLVTCPYNATHRFPAEHERLHLDTCKDRVIEEVQKYRFNEPVPGWHGDIRNPTDFGSDNFARYTEHGAYDVRPPPGDATRPSRRKVLTRSFSVPRGPDDSFADKEVAGIMGVNDNHELLAGSLNGGRSRGDDTESSGGGSPDPRRLGGSGGLYTYDPEYRRARVSPPGSLHLNRPEEAPESLLGLARPAESPLRGLNLPRIPTPHPRTVSPLEARKHLGVGRGAAGTSDSASDTGTVEDSGRKQPSQSVAVGQQSSKLALLKMLREKVRKQRESEE